MEAVSSSKCSNFCKITCVTIPQDSNPYIRCHNNLKSHKVHTRLFSTHLLLDTTYSF
jgi:hypothetical protein